MVVGHVDNQKLSPYLTLYMKMYFRFIAKLKGKITPLKDYFVEYLQNLEIWKDFLNRT